MVGLAYVVMCYIYIHTHTHTHSNRLWTTHFRRYLSAKFEGCLYSFAYYIYSFVRYVAMHRSTFWRFRKVERVNMYHPLDQREKQLIRILRKPLKMVSMLKTLFFPFVGISSSRVWNTPLLICLFLQLQLYPKLLGNINLHLLCLSLHRMFIGQIHHQFLGIQWTVQLCLPGVLIQCHRLLSHKQLKVLSCSYSVLPVETRICFLSSKIIISSILLTSYMPGFLDDAGLAGPTVAQNCCYSSSNESTPKTRPTGEKINQGDHGNTARG